MWKKQAPRIENVIPYVMLGVAMTQYRSVKYDIPLDNAGSSTTSATLNNDRDFDLNVGFGVKLDLLKYLLLDLGYAYISLGKTYTSKTDTSYIKGHQAILSVILHF